MSGVCWTSGLDTRVSVVDGRVPRLPQAVLGDVKGMVSRLVFAGGDRDMPEGATRERPCVGQHSLPEVKNLRFVVRCGIDLPYAGSDFPTKGRIMWDGCSVSCRICLLYTSPSPRDRQKSRMPSSA